LVGEDAWKEIVKFAYLSSIDTLWIDHLDAVDDLRSGIGLRSYGQRDPLVEYKSEAFSMFERLVSSVDFDIAHRIFRVEVQLTPDQAQAVKREQQTAISREAEKERKKTTNPTPLRHGFGGQRKLGRNDQCPCGSGKKWKKCHYPEIP